jgi:hypothetical protein
MLKYMLILKDLADLILKYMPLLKDLADLVQAAAVFLGVVVGGLWTYLHFIRKRVPYPRAKLDLQVYDSILTESSRLVHAVILINNTSEVLLSPDRGELRIRQVVPLPPELRETVQAGRDPVPEGKAEIEWPIIEMREWQWGKHDFEIEPGESDSLHADFIIQSNIEVVEFYCFISNPKKKRNPLGWPLTKLHTLKTNMEAN